MPLIHNNNLGLYAGVSTQAIDLRPQENCEEMINCYPSIAQGVRRRNPTQLISNSISVENNQFLYTYDRGLSGESSEQYVVTIDAVNKLRVFDIISNTYRTVTYSGSALKYIESSNSEIGFSAITIKDSTFIVNRDIIPLRVGDVIASSLNGQTISFNSLGFSTNTPTIDSINSNGVPTSSVKTGLAPATIKTYTGTYSINSQAKYDNPNTYYIKAESSVGATMTITIDGVIYTYQVSTRVQGYNSYPETISEMRANIYQLLLQRLNLNIYNVLLDTNNTLNIIKLDGSAITVTITISHLSSVDTNPNALTTLSSISYPPALSYGIGGSVHVNLLASNQLSIVGWTYTTTYPIGASVISSISPYTSTDATQGISTYNKDAFIWIKQVSVDTTFPYTFTVTLKDINGNTISTTSSNATTSSGVASAIATWASGIVGFVGVADGSVVKITQTSGVGFNIVVSDTYGSQASSSWKGYVVSMSDLPKVFPFKDTIVKIDGVNVNDKVAYWVKYDGNRWVEWRDPNMKWQINSATMPHQLIRNADYSFTLTPVTWDGILVGDENSQSLPEFLGNAIKDLFFVGGRLGFLTKNGISLSQQGVFTNFFRTTILSLLDDSAITTYIDSNKSVGLEYAAELQGSIILFGDKLQFEILANKAITPASITVHSISGFEINTNVKPITSGDSVFFLVSKSGYSTLMEMNKNTLSMNIRANDVSAHIPNYITNDIIQIVASQRDNVIFLRGRKNTNTVYVYKHYGTDTEKLQMAWSEWVFGMNIQSIFVFDKELFLFGKRINSLVPIDEYPLVGVWNDNKIWNDITNWVDTVLTLSPSFEKLDVDSYAIGANFKDLGSVFYNSTIFLSEWSLVKATGKKELRGTLLIKTIQISSNNNSNFYLIVSDIERQTTRLVPSIYTVNRKPFISGNARNMRLGISSVGGDGFQINSISLEGQYNVHSKMV